MSRTNERTKRFMKQFNRRLKTFLDLESSHCGIPSLVDEANEAKESLKTLVRLEVDKLNTLVECRNRP